MVKRPSEVTAPLTVEQYLARERNALVGHEYVAGEIFAMSPISPRHSTITLNIARHLHEATRAKGCRLLSDVLTKIAEDRFYYPDIVITCAPLGHKDLVESPCFIVEVTSPSTRGTDLREKPLAYRGARSIQGILTVEQNRRHVISHTRVGHAWSRAELKGSGTIDIPCIDARLTLDQIYETLDLPMRVREEDQFAVEEYGREWVLVPAESVS